MNRLRGACCRKPSPVCPVLQQEKAPCAYARHYMLRMRIEPGLAVEHIQGHTAPLQVVSAMCIAIDLDVHHQRVGLLYLADLAELHLVAEAGAECVVPGKGAEISGRCAGQHEENRRRAQQDEDREQRRSSGKRKRHLSMRVIAR